VNELRLCIDDKTRLQPRIRKSPTRPAQPVWLGRKYEWEGALNLFAAFDTRNGKVKRMIAEGKQLCIADFADHAALANRMGAFIREWNEVAHPYAWRMNSLAKIVVKRNSDLLETPAEPAELTGAARFLRLLNASLYLVLPL
jgi:hypothetical protein